MLKGWIIIIIKKHISNHNLYYEYRSDQRRCATKTYLANAEFHYCSLLCRRTEQPIIRRRYNFQQTVGIIYSDIAIQACGVSRNKQ
jgi:hypothetical protein